ncbi:MAG TPA: hypothetical protein VFW60_00335 [Rhodanobacteraceae bacterium]|nr:hypothetical protein [Rhodanobacteraceae bacterium]
MMHRANDILCSNSLHFLLSEAEDSIDIDYLYYDADIMSIMFGLQHYRPFVPTANGNKIHQYYHCNFTVSADLAIQKQDKPEVPASSSFAEYSAFLTSEIRRVTANAAAPERSVGYEPLATVSSGYDSPACATLGRSAGCRNAITFTTARADFEDRNDCGTPIATALGLNVTEFNFFGEGRQRLDYPEAEFIASGHGGDEITMMVLEPHLSGKLLYTGYHGDKVWDKNLKSPTPYIVRGDPSGSSLAEFRFRVGFINLPVPFIGCIRHPAIHAISNSEEMQPWSLNNSYDRPIPRRIVEEAGVERSLFGQQKKAVAMAYLNNSPDDNPPMDEILCEHSYRDFLAFIAPLKQYRRWNHTLRYDAMHWLYRLNQRVTWSGKLRRLLGPLGPLVPARMWVPWKYAHPRSNNPLAFHWAAGKMQARYSRPTRECDVVASAVTDRE